MQCNERFFGQRHFDAGIPVRAWCDRLRRLKPHMCNGGFALRDRLPALPDHAGGLAQVKYNGMLGVAMWDEEKDRFVVWNHQGRWYFSLAVCIGSERVELERCWGSFSVRQLY